MKFNVTIRSQMLIMTAALVIAAWLIYANYSKHRILTEVLNQHEQLNEKIKIAKNASADRQQISKQTMIDTIPPSKYANPFDAGEAFLSDYPQIRGLLKTMRRANTYSTYWGLIKQYNLTEAQIAELENIMKDTIAIQKNIPDYGRAVLRLPYDGGGNGQNRLIDLFGQAGYEELLNASAAFQGNLHMQDILYTMSLTDTPITLKQAARLKEIIAKGIPYFDVEDSKTSMPVNEYWNNIVDQARAFLSEHQIEELDKIRITENYYRMRRQLMTIERKKLTKTQ